MWTVTLWTTRAVRKEIFLWSNQSHDLVLKSMPHICDVLLWLEAAASPCWVINQCAYPDLLTKYPWTDAHGMGAARPRPLRTVYLLRIDYAGDTRKGPAASKGGEWKWEKSWTDPDWRTKLLFSRQKACEPKSSASPIHVCAHLLGLLLNCGFWFSRSWVGPGSLHFLQVPSDALILQIGLWVAKP